jgi:hypothetical protein
MNLSFLIFTANSFTPCSEKTKSVYHLALLLARELFVKVSGFKGSEVQRFKGSVVWQLASRFWLLANNQQQVASSQWPGTRSLRAMDPRTFEPLNAEPRNLILQLIESIVESLAIHQFQVGAGFNNASPV